MLTAAPNTRQTTAAAAGGVDVEHARLAVHPMGRAPGLRLVGRQPHRALIGRAETALGLVALHLVGGAGVVEDVGRLRARRRA